MLDFSSPHNPPEKLYKPELGPLWILTRKSTAQSLVFMPTESLSILQGAFCTPLPLPIILEEREKGLLLHQCQRDMDIDYFSLHKYYSLVGQMVIF